MRVSTHDGGAWVVVATVRLSGGRRLGMPVLEKGCADMRRWSTLDAVLSEAYQDSAVRLGGGWAIHLQSGRIEPIEPIRRAGGTNPQRS